MDIKFGQSAIVVDNDDNYVEVVVMFWKEGSETWQPYEYILKDGEHLLFDVSMPPYDMCLKHWTGSAWVEAATEEQKAEWKKGLEIEQPVQEVSLMQRVEAVEHAILDIMLGGDIHV